MCESLTECALVLVSQIVISRIVICILFAIQRRRVRVLSHEVKIGVYLPLPLVKACGLRLD